jgi:hypothetical protein
MTVAQILSAICTADQAAAFMRNSWRYARLGNSHVRIHPPSSDVSVNPNGPVRYVASIELLGSEAAPWGRAERDAIDAIGAVFGSMLAQADRR